MIKINHNGSKWAGQAPDSIQTLLQTLEQYPLDPTFEDYGNFVYPFVPTQWTEKNEQYRGCTSFSGNFYSLSHSFSIITDDEALIELLTIAVRSNQSRTDYKVARVEYLATKQVKDIADKMFRNNEFEGLQQYYAFPRSDEGMKLYGQFTDELSKELVA